MAYPGGRWLGLPRCPNLPGLHGRRDLRPRRYRLVLVATNGQAHAHTVTATFVVSAAELTANAGGFAHAEQMLIALRR